MSTIAILTALSLLPLLSTALIEEFEFRSTGDAFVLEGTYEPNEKAKEFWICVDYDSTSRSHNHFAYTLRVEPDLLSKLLRQKAQDAIADSLVPNAYPVEKCGGSMRARKDPYWYALHGVWKAGGKVLEIRFVSAFEVWVETWSTNVKPVDHELAWNSNVLQGARRHVSDWRLVQKHSETTNGSKKPTISVLNLVGTGRVNTMRPLSEDTTIFVRLRGQGVRINSYTVDLSPERDDQFSKFYERLRRR